MLELGRLETARGQLISWRPKLGDYGPSLSPIRRAAGVEDRQAVVDDGIDVRDVGRETVGEAVALVVDGTDGEAAVAPSVQ